MADKLTLKRPAGDTVPAGGVVYYCIAENGVLREYPMAADGTVADVDPADLEQLHIAGLVLPTASPTLSQPASSAPTQQPSAPQAPQSVQKPAPAPAPAPGPGASAGAGA